jgi:hypothetical protein
MDPLPNALGTYRTSCALTLRTGPFPNALVPFRTRWSHTQTPWVYIDFPWVFTDRPGFLPNAQGPFL